MTRVPVYTAVYGSLWTGGQFGRLDTGERNKAVTDSMKDVTKIAAVSYTTVSRALTSSRVNAGSTIQIQRIIAGIGDPPSAAGQSLAIPQPCAPDVALITNNDPLHGDNLLLYDAGVETALNSRLNRGARRLLCSDGMNRIQQD